MRRDEVRAFLDGYYADRVANDAASVLKYVTPGMTYMMAGSLEDAPADATGRGPAAITDIVHAMVSAWKWRSVAIRMMLIDTDCAAVHFDLRVQYAPTGETVDMDVGNFWTFRDRACVSLVEFADTALIRRLAL